MNALKTAVPNEERRFFVRLRFIRQEILEGSEIKLYDQLMELEYNRLSKEDRK